MGKGIGLLLAVLVVGGTAIMKVRNKGDIDNQTKTQFVEVLEAAMPNYNTHGPLYLEWLDIAHPKAFEASFDLGGRREANTFDEDAYVDACLREMAKAARARRYSDCADHLEEFRAALADFEG